MFHGQFALSACCESVSVGLQRHMCGTLVLCMQGVAINFVKSDDIRILRDIEQYYSTQVDEMVSNVASVANCWKHSVQPHLVWQYMQVVIATIMLSDYCFGCAANECGRLDLRKDGWSSLLICCKLSCKLTHSEAGLHACAYDGQQVLISLNCSAGTLLCCNFGSPECYMLQLLWM